MSIVRFRSEGLSFSFGGRSILQDISFAINDNDKVGLVGVNGAGKTTLFKLILGEYKPDTGKIEIVPNTKILHMDQIVVGDNDRTILEEVLEGYADVIAMEDEIFKLEQDMTEELDEGKLNVLINKHCKLIDKFRDCKGYEYFSRAKGILRGLGFSEDEFNKKVSFLSGGQKTRLRLAKLLNLKPDVLLLDEPTNHLDIGSIEWLERFVNGYNKCIVIISHDRFFLDRTVGKIMEIENTKITTYNGNYSEYIKQKEIARDIQRRHYENQQREIKRQKAIIQQQRQWNRQRNIIAAESRQKALDRMEKEQEPERLPDKVRFKFSVRRNSGNEVLAVRNVSMSYPGVDLFHDISFDVTRGERIFLLGENGIGKSTMLKIILGEIIPKSGNVKFGANVDVDYYSQDLSGLKDTNTIYNEVLNIAEGLSKTDIRNALASFLFKDDSVDKEVGSLSGGEKGRLALCKIMLNRGNFLLLDEPTNHLDINSKEVFEDVLKEYEGTLLVVSHDRYFIDKLATRVIELTHEGILDVCGNYSFYREHKDLNKVEDKKNDIKVCGKSKEDYNNAKEKKRMQQKVKRDIARYEEMIEKLERSISDVHEEMARPDVASDYVRLGELDEIERKLKDELKGYYDEWEKTSLKFEEI